MKIIAANLRPLSSKHYSTELSLVVNVAGWNYNINIDISGYAPIASTRELARGWEPDQGMDHVESEVHYRIAKDICAFLEGVDL